MVLIIDDIDTITSLAAEYQYLPSEDWRPVSTQRAIKDGEYLHSRKFMALVKGWANIRSLLLSEML